MASYVPSKRYDVFLSFHGSEGLSFPQNDAQTVRKFVQNYVIKLVRQEWRKDGVGRLSIFFDDFGITEHLKEIKEAVLQTRGGGVMVCLISKNYLSREWCQTELKLAAKYCEREEKIRMALVCFDWDIHRIKENEIIKEANLVENKFHDIALTENSGGEMKQKDPGRVAREIAEKALQPLRQNSCVAGDSIQSSFANLLEIVSLKFPGPARLANRLQLRGRFSENLDVLLEASRRGKIAEKNIDKLREVLESEDAEDALLYVNSYHAKWLAYWIESSWDVREISI